MIDTDCQMIPLGEESIVFIKKVLGDGLTLSRLIKERNIVESSGKTFAFLTDDSDVEAVRNFTADQYNRGYIVHSGDTNECLASYIWKHLKEDENRLCLLENYDVNPTSPLMKRLESPVVFLDTEVYDVVSKASGSAEAVLNEILKAARVWIFMGVLTQVQDSSRWLAASTITADDLEDAVEHITHVFVMAFDGEGYVVWQAKES